MPRLRIFGHAPMARAVAASRVQPRGRANLNVHLSLEAPRLLRAWKDLVRKTPSATRR